MLISAHFEVLPNYTQKASFKTKKYYTVFRLSFRIVSDNYELLQSFKHIDSKNFKLHPSVKLPLHTSECQKLFTDFFRRIKRQVTLHKRETWQKACYVSRHLTHNLSLMLLNYGGKNNFTCVIQENKLRNFFCLVSHLQR